MSKIALPITVLMLALGASASADTPPGFSSSDFGLAAVTQDFRSPDARQAPPAEAPAAPATQDLRSPDSGPAGAFAPPVPAAPAVEPSDGSFAWGFLAAGIAAALLATGAALITYRRRHHGLAPGA
jgi:hypothetical protein